MALLDDDEYARWHDTAAGHLAAARYNADGGHHHVAVLLAEQASQGALKALLHGVGASVQARTHDLLALADARVELTGLPLDDELREALATRVLELAESTSAALRDAATGDGP